MQENDIKPKFYIVPEAIALQYQAAQKENLQINFIQTNKNLWVINVNCGEDVFTEIDFKSFEIVELTMADFMPTYEDRPLVNGFRLVSVFDHYNGTIEINLFKDNEITTILRQYKYNTWTDKLVFEYINEL